MMEVRRASDRGNSRTDWLESRHTFSFSDYYDPRYMGFRTLRVINEDVVKPGEGFGTHSHRDMEILSYVLEGGQSWLLDRPHDIRGQMPMARPETHSLHAIARKGSALLCSGFRLL